MQIPLVSQERLASATKVLFIVPLVLQDFQYIQTYLRAFKQQWPHAELHVWLDDARRTRFFWRWKRLQRHALYDWLHANDIFNKVYAKTYSPGVYKASVREARAYNYPVVVSLARVQPHRYARLARTISPHGFVVGTRDATSIVQQFKRWQYRHFDAALNLASVQGEHITDVYAAMFEQFFGLVVATGNRAPFIVIPRQWVVYASLTLLKWGVNRKQPGAGKIVFVNTFSYNAQRCWPLQKAFDLIRQMQAMTEYSNAYFIVYTEPEHYRESLNLYYEHAIGNTQLFSARESFFQLPAMLSLCDIIVSVESSVIHLATALGKPVIALMRQNNAAWLPWNCQRSCIVTAAKRADRITTISVAAVKDGVLMYSHKQR